MNDDHSHVIAKGLEAGLLSDWGHVMNVAISNTDLEKDVEEASK